MSTKLHVLPESEVEIEGTLSVEDYSTERAAVLHELNKEISLPGFRKGHVPENILVERVGEISILSQMVDRAVRARYPEFIMEHNLIPIGRPHIHIEKVESGKPVDFKIHTAVFPTLSLPDYKALAKDFKKTDVAAVETKDIDAVLADLQKMKARNNETETEPLKEGEEKKEPVLPELNDEFAQALGPFPTIVALREKIGENLKFEREKESKDKHRLLILEAVIEKTKAEIPKILIESELGIMFSELRSSISRAGLEWDEYLKKINKTEDDMRKEWHDQAKKRAIANLVLREIGKLENLAPDDEAITTEVLRILNDYQGADPERTRAYVEEVLFNDKVFTFLEKASEK